LFQLKPFYSPAVPGHQEPYTAKTHHLSPSSVP
jgi:hypothetical protein